jgi:uncharacterized membrane protein
MAEEKTEEIIVAKNKDLHSFFEWVIILKGIQGFFELLIGALLSFTNVETIKAIIFYFFGLEITEDPGSWLANHFIDFGYSISPDTKVFIAFYLIFYGVLNVFLVIALLKNKLWAYPAAIGLFIFFLVYQVIRYFSNYSNFLLAMIFINIFVIMLIWFEYKNLRKKEKRKQ